MTSSVSSVVFRCADLERTASFYRALGLELEREQHGKGPVHWSCAFGPAVIEFYPATPERPVGSPTSVVLAVDDPDMLLLDLAHSHSVVASAVRVIDRDARDRITKFVIPDPDGRTVTVVKRK